MKSFKFCISLFDILSYTNKILLEQKRVEHGLEEDGQLRSKNVHVIVVMDSFLNSLSTLET